jgi:hypothetical protein
VPAHAAKAQASYATILTRFRHVFITFINFDEFRHFLTHHATSFVYENACTSLGQLETLQIKFFVRFSDFDIWLGVGSFY